MHQGSEAPRSSRHLIKDMLHSSSLYMIVMVGQRMASLILIPVVTKHLSTADYGALDLLEQIGSVFSVLLGTGIAVALGYFFFEPGAQKSKVVGTLLTGATMLGTLAALLGMLLAEPLSRGVLHSAEYTPYLRFVFGVMPITFLLEAGTSWLRTENRTTLFTITALLRVGLIIVATLVLVGGFGFRIVGILGANFLAIVSSMIIITIAAVRSYGISFDRSLFLRMARYSIPISLSGLAMFVVHFGDRFILPYYRSLAELGVYSIAYKFGMLITMVHSSFHTYWSAQLFQIVQRQDAGPVFARTFTYMMSVLAFCSLGLLVASRPAIHLLTQPAYYGAIILIPVLLSAYLLRAIGDFFRTIFMVKGLPSYDAACNWIGAAVCLVGYFLLIPPYGVMGAAVATLISFLVVGLISVVGCYRLWPFVLEKRLAKLGVVTVGLTAIYFMLPPASPLVEIAQGMAMLLAFVIILACAQFPTKPERELVFSFASRMLRR
jgi:O-antigen/teichoic acid export membrane protein